MGLGARGNGYIARTLSVRRVAPCDTGVLSLSKERLTSSRVARSAHLGQKLIPASTDSLLYMLSRWAWREERARPCPCWRLVPHLGETRRGTSNYIGPCTALLSRGPLTAHLAPPQCGGAEEAPLRTGCVVDVGSISLSPCPHKRAQEVVLPGLQRLGSQIGHVPIRVNVDQLHVPFINVLL